MKEISIIIVTHNSSQYIESCLDSIFAQSFKDYEIIVVDNASGDDTKTIIKNKYMNIVLIENLDNFGACKARNQGITKSKGRFILCLDHDVKLLDNFLSNIYEVIESKNDIGAIGPKILMAGAKTIYSTGIHRSYLNRFHDTGSGKQDGSTFEKKKYVFGVSAAAALYRREALEAIKQDKEYFDEDFFYFFEDVDASWRMQKKGWRILYTPKAGCLHISGRSRNKDKITQYFCVRNRYLLIIKNESLFGFLRLFFVFLIYDLWRNIFLLITNYKYSLKALSEVVKLTPKMLQKRKITISNYEN